MIEFSMQLGATGALILMLMKGTLRPLALLAFAMLLCQGFLPKQAYAAGETRLYIDRKGMTLYVIGGASSAGGTARAKGGVAATDAGGATVGIAKTSGGTVLAKYPIGIGKGSLQKVKRSMSDNITPTGDFTVELVLSRKSHENAVASSFQKRYQSSPQYTRLVESKSGLAQLFKNMNSIDFNADGKPDNAYGTAYIGLTSKRVITGPKMRMYGKTPYWYSIAIHGTPDPDRTIGRATSGGCVHLGEDGLMKLIGEKFVKVGTRVIIADAPPS